MKNDLQELVDFMSNPTLKGIFNRMIVFFSIPTPGLKEKHLKPRELKEYWDSLSGDEKVYWMDPAIWVWDGVNYTWKVI